MSDFYAVATTSRWKLFRHIFWQEFLPGPKSKVAIEQRREELLRYNAIEALYAQGADAIKKQLSHRLNAIKQKANDRVAGLQLQALMTQNSISLEEAIAANKPIISFLKEEDQQEYYTILARLNQPNTVLVDKAVQQIVGAPRKSDLECIKDYNANKSGQYKKWGGTAYRGIAAAIGAALGGVAGTLLFPGLGTGVGAALGAAVGGVIGVVLLGPVANMFIVEMITPFSNARKQSKEILKYRKKQYAKIQHRGSYQHHQISPKQLEVMCYNVTNTNSMVAHRQRTRQPLQEASRYSSGTSPDATSTPTMRLVSKDGSVYHLKPKEKSLQRQEPRSPRLMSIS